tara:strand:- start:45 stop:2750 length:2706 start_codon:yes stop_codon:yes gene_type:complete
MRNVALLLCIILVFGSLSGCLGSNTSPGTEESEQNGEQNSQSDNETDAPIPLDDVDGGIDRSGQRVNIHGLPWSTLMADCDDELKSTLWDARGLVELFNALDYDDSGDLSYCEIFVNIDKRLMPYDSEYAMHRWTAGDTDSFTFDEYFDFEQSRSPGIRYQEDSYLEAFNIADRNQDNQIDETEIDSFITETYEVYTFGILVDNDLFVESTIDSMRDGTLPLADIGDDGYLSFDEFAEFHYLGDEDYLYSVYFIYNEYSWIFEHTRGFSPQQLFNITDSDGDGFITSDDLVYLGNEFENDMEFYWDFCEIDSDSGGYMCWLSDWELDDNGEHFSECEEVTSGAWYCDGGATDDEDEEEDEDEEDDTTIGSDDWYHYPYGYCEWDGSDSRFQCKFSESDEEWHNEWYYCNLFGFKWHCTDYYGQLSDGDSNYYYFWWEYIYQFEDEYREDLVLSIFNCAKGNDGLVNNSEFENLYYLMQVDSPSDVSFCLLDSNSDGSLSIDEIVNATNQFAGLMSDLSPISALNYDALLERFATADVDMDLTLDEDEFTQSNYWKSMGYRNSYSTFLCEDGYLIPASYLDDGEEDCPDGSDEIEQGSGGDYDGDITRITLGECTQQDITSCSGFGCGFPSLESLDSNGNGTLDLNEFTNGLYAVDDYYSMEEYENMFAYLIYYFYDDGDDDEDDDEDDEDGYQNREINQSMYEMIGIDNNNEICIAFGCGFPTFEEVDADGNSIVDKDEFVNKMLSIDPSGFELYNSTFDEFSGDDDLVNVDEYEEFLHDVDDSYDNDEYEDTVDYSERGLLFSKNRGNCWHIKFFDGTNPDYSGWGGAVRFTDADGVVTTIEDFSSAYTFLTLTGSESWLIEYMFTEEDVGFEIDGLRYGGDNGDEDSDFNRALYITFSG